ncbi:MAG: Fe3+-siderophores ABC transporter protein [Oligoflexia bacterium]|nr:Fe3+-siderophores ABC transporter protein [Oligoflexia bacterium]
MKVISMVPSWTETLLICGVEVVGRTRFCIHPLERIKNIPIVGGTKDIDWEKVKELKADILLLDKEENPAMMAKKSPIQCYATHMRSFTDGPEECVALSKLFQNKHLSFLAERWKFLSAQKANYTLSNLPGITEWVNPLKDSVKNFIYVIWYKPWMAVSCQTYIGSVLNILGVGQMQRNFLEPYPEFNLSDFDPNETALLCSSEPYPFHMKKDFLKTLPFSVALVDGEVFSWFGVRSVKFVESALADTGH